MGVENDNTDFHGFDFGGNASRTGAVHLLVLADGCQG